MLVAHPVALTLLYSPQDAAACKIADMFVEHFDRIGMRRAGVHVRIPLRVRCEALDATNGTLYPIRRTGSELDVIVVLHGTAMDHDPGRWTALCSAAAVLTPRLLGLVVKLDDGIGSLGVFGSGQLIEWNLWRDSEFAQRLDKLLIHVVNAIRRKLGNWQQGEREKIFISHAKADGKAIAEGFVRHVNDPANALRLDLFYDAQKLESGEDWAAGLGTAVKSASFLGLATEAYDARPWCNQEILWAKEHRRPAVMVDVGRRRVHRTFPYAGNLMLIAEKADDDASIDRVLLQLLSEALRCDIFERMAKAAGIDRARGVVALPRPPEMADLAFLAGAPEIHTIVYPDPPLPGVEIDLLRRLAAARRIVSFGDFNGDVDPI